MVDPRRLTPIKQSAGLALDVQNPSASLALDFWTFTADYFAEQLISNISQLFV